MVFFHSDLDGIVSYLVLCWSLGKKLDYIPTTPRTLQADWEKWSEKKQTTENLYFLDLDVTKIGPLIDKKHTFIVDHHKTNTYCYKHAKSIVKNESSCAKLLYNILFKKSDNSLTSAQKTLIALADDLDSYTLAHPLSTDLNIVFHNTRNKITSFIEDYYIGFKPFDMFKSNIIKLYKKHQQEYIKKIEPYFGKIEIEGEPTLVGAVFCDQYVSECCDHIFQKYNTDIAIAVMLKQNRIAVRRNLNNNKIDVSRFVQRIVNGGGHEQAAGGPITEDFIEFTKMLKPISAILNTKND